jgi:hypothetical protein
MRASARVRDSACQLLASSWVMRGQLQPSVMRILTMIRYAAPLNKSAFASLQHWESHQIAGAHEVL